MSQNLLTLEMNKNDRLEEELKLLRQHRECFYGWLNQNRDVSESMSEKMKLTKLEQSYFNGQAAAFREAVNKFDEISRDK